MAEVTLRLEAVAIILFTLLGTSDSYSLFHSRRGNDPNAIYFDGNIYTVNPADPEWDKHPQQAMVINRNTGKIVFVGTNDEAFEKYDNGQYTELSSIDTRIITFVHFIDSYLGFLNYCKTLIISLNECCIRYNLFQDLVDLI